MDKIMEIRGAYEIVLGVGGFAAFLGVLSLLLRYRKMETPLARRICFASDILNTTFVSITVVGVLTVSFQVAILVPRNLNATKSEILADLNEVKDLMPREDQIAQRVAQLVKANLRSAVEDLEMAENFKKDTLNRAVREALGNWNATENLRISGEYPKQWSCISEGAELQCDIP